jgi:hypothetical protein
MIGMTQNVPSDAPPKTAMVLRLPSTWFSAITPSLTTTTTVITIIATMIALLLFLLPNLTFFFFPYGSWIIIRGSGGAFPYKK